MSAKSVIDSLQSNYSICSLTKPMKKNGSMEMVGIGERIIEERTEIMKIRQGTGYLDTLIRATRRC
jgi:hypothetical protein